MNPRDFLLTATDLLASGRREADIRSAVSRSYYAVYLVMRGLTKEKVVYTGAGDHTKVLDFARREWPRDRYQRFSNLQDRRYEADYDMTNKISKDRAEFAVRLARSLLAELEGRPPS